MTGPSSDFKRARVYGLRFFARGYDEKETVIRKPLKEISEGWLPENERDPVIAWIFADLHFTPPVAEETAN